MKTHNGNTKCLEVGIREFEWLAKQLENVDCLRLYEMAWECDVQACNKHKRIMCKIKQSIDKCEQNMVLLTSAHRCECVAFDEKKITMHFVYEK